MIFYDFFEYINAYIYNGFSNMSVFKIAIFFPQFPFSLWTYSTLQSISALTHL